MKTSHYKINAMFASKEGIPTSFVATELGRTDKAVYVYGHGAVDPQGSCCRCGRTLTHPGSILLGIGPECLGDWGARELRLENISDKDRAYMKSLIEEQIIDCWIPKSIVKSKKETKEDIDVPKDHKMLQKVKIQKQLKKNKTATVNGNEFKITFPYDQETVSQVKQLEGRKYNPEGKFWTCPVNTSNTKSLREFGFEILGMEAKEIKEILSPKTSKTVKPIQVSEYKKKLRPFQEIGVGFIDYKNGRALVGDDMGLGKTIETLAWLQLYPNKTPVVVVCPAGLKLNWAREIKEGMVGRDAIILQGTKPSPTLQIFGTATAILIINYDILDAWVVTLKKLNPQVIILDEGHKIKNNSAKRTKAVKKLVKGVPHIIGLTGTPIENRPSEIYNLVNLIDPTLFPNPWSFKMRYCNPKHNGFGWDFNGASNINELHEKLQSVMIRRKKSEVLKELPDKIYSFVPFELDNQEEYDTAENNFISYIKNTKGKEAAEKASNAEVLSQIEALKQLAVKGKMKVIIEWIKNFLESDEKLVVFAIHKVVINALMEVFGDVAVKIDGSVAMKDRDDVVQRFQNDDNVRLFVGNVKAAGLGLTLTAASNVAFLELPWTPGELVQAEDRCHRIGQEDSVTIYYLLTQGTIEEEIALLLDSKRKVLDAVLDGQDTEDDSLLSELMNKYLN